MGYERLRNKRKQVLKNRSRSRLKEEQYTDVNERPSLWRRFWNLIK